MLELLVVAVAGAWFELFSWAAASIVLGVGTAAAAAAVGLVEVATAVIWMPKR